MISLFFRRLFMTVSSSKRCPNGKRCYSGFYNNGHAVYFYDLCSGNRIYNGKFWYKRKSYNNPSGRLLETAIGYFKNNKKNGKWEFTQKSKGLNKKLIASFTDGKHEGIYNYKAVCHSRTFNFKTGKTTLKLRMSAELPVGEVKGYFYGEKLTGHYDNAGRPDGLWQMDRTKTACCIKDFEIWEHGICKESYSVDESTGEKTRTRSQIPELVANIIYKEGSYMERLTNKKSTTYHNPTPYKTLVDTIKNKNRPSRK